MVNARYDIAHESERSTEHCACVHDGSETVGNYQLLLFFLQFLCVPCPFGVCLSSCVFAVWLYCARCVLHYCPPQPRESR